MSIAGFARLIIDPLYRFPECGRMVKAASEGSLNRLEREAGNWRHEGKGGVSCAALSAQPKLNFFTYRNQKKNLTVSLEPMQQ